MTFAQNYTSVTNQLSQQINPVDIRIWVFIPVLFGIALTIIILSIWQPKFEGTYEYDDCSDARKINGKVVDTNECVKKEGNLAKRNAIIILILFLLIPGIFGGLGYKLGFYIANPKIGAGIYASGLFFQGVRGK
tara:strand:+ start:306 stop:707 length:402 start_codon:yes stop_codon:yes gene_type:complete